MNHEMIDFLWGRFKYTLESTLSEIAAFAFGSDEIEGNFDSDILFCALEDLPYYINQNDPLSQHIINERINGNNSNHLIIPYLMNKAETDMLRTSRFLRKFSTLNDLHCKVSAACAVFETIKDGLVVAKDTKKASIVKDYIEFSRAYKYRP